MPEDKYSFAPTNGEFKGVRTFAQVNSTLSVLTGVPTSNSTVNATYLAVQQQLPPTPAQQFSVRKASTAFMVSYRAA